MAFSFNPPAIGHARMCSCGHAAMVHHDLHACKVPNCKCRRFDLPANKLSDRLNLESLSVLLAFKKRLQPKIPVINIYGAQHSTRMDKRIEDTSWIAS